MSDKSLPCIGVLNVPPVASIQGTDGHPFFHQNTAIFAHHSRRQQICPVSAVLERTGTRELIVSPVEDSVCFCSLLNAFGPVGHLPCSTVVLYLLMN
jgi:hypothetical protein